MSDAQAMESMIEPLCGEGRYDDATAALLRAYGSEILGVLVAMARDESQAAEAYSMFCEQVWRGMPNFRFECPCRAWAYTIAKRSLFGLMRRRRAAPDRPCSASDLPDVVQRVASTTAPYLRTTYKQELREIRALLSPEDQLLLVLRVDKELAWNDVARVLSEEEEPGPEQLQRTSVVLRKRFSRAKTRLADALRARRAHERSEA
ncbi:MAG: RNA polymerase sigma factor [Nannocystales bacterium]